MNTAVATGGPPDTTAPSAPSAASAAAVSATQIDVSWTASTDNVAVTGYELERCQGVSCTSFVQIATPVGTSYNDTGLTESTSYSYRIRATDAAGNLSAYSNVASDTTPAAPDTTAPSAPSAASAAAVSATQIDVSWTASTDNVAVTGYELERCQGVSCTSFVQIATPAGTSYNDTGLTESTSYSYRVRASDAAGNLSGYSTPVSATTPAAPDITPPSATNGLSATTASASQIDLSWSAATDNVGVTGYRVERCDGSACTSFVEIAQPTATTYADTGLIANTSYSYRVRAMDAALNLGAYSTVASATTSAAAQASVYYIHADHLNTPRVITDVNQVAVWRWDNSDPFGANVASEDPDGNGIAVTFNLRFPGQYFDQETGNHYNFFRDYNPSTGRYIESDPIGLDGGLNTFGYVEGNPLSQVDPTGLNVLKQALKLACRKLQIPLQAEKCVDSEKCFANAKFGLNSCLSATYPWTKWTCQECWKLYASSCPNATPDPSCNSIACATPTPSQTRPMPS